MDEQDRTRVVLDITTSVDGLIAGPADDVSRLHEWLFDGDTPSAYSSLFKLSRPSATVFDRLVETTGSIITGKRTYDIAGGWGGSHPVSQSVFVLTRDAPREVPEGTTTFTFVSNGMESAVRQAREAAGRKNVYLMGGANVVQQCVREGLLDEMVLHVVPVLLGTGIRLFGDLHDHRIDLERTMMLEAPGVTHLGFRVIR